MAGTLSSRAFLGVSLHRVTASHPASTLLAWWGTAWLQGLASADELLDAMEDVAPVHSTEASPADPSGAWDGVAGPGLIHFLGALRRAGAQQLGATFPGEGDPIGLGGPRAFNQDATEAGEALLCPEAGVGAVPHHVGSGVAWVVHSCRSRPVPDVAEADRTLRGVLLATVEALERLDVAAWSSDATDALLDLARIPETPSVPGVGQRPRAVAARAVSASHIAALALRDHGGATTAAETAARATAVRELDRAARGALTAASSPWCWPPMAPEA